MKKVIIALVVALVLLSAAFLAYIWSGKYDVSQLTRHSASVQWVIDKTLSHSIKQRLKEIVIPPLNDSLMIIEGFAHYNAMCVMCHGAPGIDPYEMTKGLYPEPPLFYKSKDLPGPAVAFWITKYGIKLTSMPAFTPTHNDEIIWKITSFLTNKLNKMSPEEYSDWVAKYSTVVSDPPR
jgi:mono/diheme cytochrome c family protein